MNKDHRCFGITKRRFCQRRGNWLLFCHDHRYQWIGWLVFLFVTLGGGTIWNIMTFWPKADTFALADCTFDAWLEIPQDGLAIYRSAFPGETGTVTLIIHIYKDKLPEQFARLQLTGKWQGTSGMIPIYLEDMAVFTLSERLFTFIHKRPIVEHVPNKMQRMSIGSHYKIDLTAFPGFAVPLVPKQLNIRTREGVLYTISDFAGPDRGWYSTTFSP